MKKLLLILGGLGLLLVAAVTFIAYFALGSKEKEANRNKTAAARNARWQPKSAEDAEVIFQEENTNHQPPEGELKTETNEKTE